MKNKSAYAFALAGLVSGMSSARADEKWDLSKLDLSKLPPAAGQPGLTYTNDIRPLFETACFRCHGEQRPKGGLRLDSLEAVLQGGETGKVVIPGDSQKSLLVAAAAQLNEEIAMPPKRGPGGPGGPGGPPGGFRDGGPGKRESRPSGALQGTNTFGPRGGGGPGGPPRPFTVEQVGLLRAWIDQGAK